MRQKADNSCAKWQRLVLCHPYANLIKPLESRLLTMEPADRVDLDAFLSLNAIYLTTRGRLPTHRPGDDTSTLVSTRISHLQVSLPAIAANQLLVIASFGYTC